MRAYILILCLTLIFVSVPQGQTANIEIQTHSPWEWQSTEVITTESEQTSHKPDIAVDDHNNLHVVWEESRVGTDDDIFYKHYDQSTSSWTSSILVSTESTKDSYLPDIAIDGLGNIHVIWVDTTNYNSAGTDTDIFYKSYNQETSSWGSMMVISSESTGTSTYPVIEVDSKNNIHIIWQDITDYNGAGTDADIFYKKFDAGVSTWGNTTVITPESTGNSWNPDMVIDSQDNINVVWRDQTPEDSDTDYDIFFKKYDQTSSSWGYFTLISTLSTSTTGNPSITVDHLNNLHVVWTDATDLNEGTDGDIHYTKFDRQKVNWELTVVISTGSTRASSFPDIVADSLGRIHVTWEDDSNLDGAGTITDIFYKNYDPISSTWTGSFDISSNEQFSFNPNIVVDNTDFIYIIWDDINDYNNAGTDRDVFLKKYSGVANTPILELGSPVEVLGIVDLEWQPTFGAASYNIYRSSTPIHDISGLTPYSTTTNSYFTENVTTSGAYYYAITAVNIEGESSVSNDVVIEILTLEDIEVIIDPSSGNETLNDTVAEVKDEGFLSIGSFQFFVVTMFLTVISVKKLKRSVN